MKVREADHDVGVIIGRFQVPELHPAHRDLIKTVCDRHDKVLIFLGLSPLLATKENPLDFQARAQMIREAFPKVEVHYVEDIPTNKGWSEKVDAQIRRLITPSQTAVLYGSRSSFIEQYEGKFPTLELEAETIISGSEIRRAVSAASTKGTADFRAGVIWAAFNQFPTTYVAVDIAIIEGDGIWLGRKPNEEQYRFPGGFLDPRDETAEAAARREAFEETGIEISDPAYVQSFAVDDWRYRKEPDRKVMSLLFRSIRVSGKPKAADDLAEVRHFLIADLDVDRDIVSAHRPLMRAILKQPDPTKE